MVLRTRNSGMGVPRRRALAICVGWFALGLGGILVALVPWRRNLSRDAELAALNWLKAQADAVRPLVHECEVRGIDAAARLPAGGIAAKEVATGWGRPDAAQLWLVSAVEGEPGLIVPVSAAAHSEGALRDFGQLQAGISEARGTATRPLAFVDAAEGRMGVAYLRLVGTGYGVAMSIRADELYAGVGSRFVACLADAIALLAAACVGLYWLIAEPGERPARREGSSG